MKKTLIALTSFLVLVTALILGVTWYVLNRPNYPRPQKIKLVVAKGETPGQIAETLYKQKLIYHPLVFKLAVRQSGLASEIKAGSFTLVGRVSPLEIVYLLTQRPEDTWIKLLEGWRREEMADYLASQDLLVFDKQEFLELTRDKEGYLFPDTYLVPKEITTPTLVKLLLNTFDKKVKQGLANEIADSAYSLDEAIIVASLLEREARGVDQMRHVAGIIYNRLEMGMPLQIDATLQYARGWDKAHQDYWSPPTPALKKLNSPYNTYLYAGLPPTPIANPGVEAVKAALKPLETEDLYYLHAPDGQIYYAQTLAEHNQNINHYLH